MSECEGTRGGLHAELIGNARPPLSARAADREPSAQGRRTDPAPAGTNCVAPWRPDSPGSRKAALPLSDHVVDVIWKGRELLGIAPDVDELRIVTLRRVLNITDANRDWHPGTDARDESMLLREAWQLLK